MTSALERPESSFAGLGLRIWMRTSALTHHNLFFCRMLKPHGKYIGVVIDLSSEPVMTSALTYHNRCLRVPTNSRGLHNIHSQEG